MAKAKEKIKDAASKVAEFVAPEPSRDVYIATDSGSCEIDGETFVFTKGVTRVRAGHGLLKSCPTFFEPVGDHVNYDVEDASAAPGTKRGE